MGREPLHTRYELEDGTVGFTNAPHFPPVGGEWWTGRGPLQTRKSRVVWVGGPEDMAPSDRHRLACGGVEHGYSMGGEA